MVKEGYGSTCVKGGRESVLQIWAMGVAETCSSISTVSGMVLFVCSHFNIQSLVEQVEVGTFFYLPDQPTRIINQEASTAI